MLDIKYIRDNSTTVAEALAKRQVKSAALDKLLSTDEKRRDLIQQLEEYRAQKNEFNKTISTLAKTAKEQKLKEMAALTAEEERVALELSDTETILEQMLHDIPNIPADDVKQGKDDSENEVIKKVGEAPSFDFKPKSYIELAEQHDLIDTERAAKVSGSRFGYLKNEGALLWNALVQYTLATVLKEGFVPFYSPVLVRKEAMENSGYDSYTHGHEAYYIDKDGLFLVGTGEHALLPYHAKEILNEESLPRKYTTYSTCFRREAGSYGKDTKGILRVHQFDKQEMVVITTPEKSWDIFDELVAIQEEIISGLKLPYHLLSVCTGDLPKPSAKVVDLECWIPSEKTYRETHSASNCTDYQARLNAIRYKQANGNKNHTHICNATGVTPRTLIAILENYQQADGSIQIPKVLQPYMYGTKIIKKKK